MAEECGEGHTGAEKVAMENNRKRRLKTPAQLMALENFYSEHKYPTEEMKTKLAEEIGLTEKQVSGWFCHRRLKDKRSRDEACSIGRQDRSSIVIQDRGSGLRQDSCGSTKQMDHKNTELREVESQRLYGHDFSAVALSYGHRNQYPLNDGGIDSTSSESSSSLQDRVVSREEGLYDVESSRYLTKNGAGMPLIPQVTRNAGYKPSGYLKVKGEIENAAITAVKRQLGRHHREDGPPLSVEFDPVPPGAFESPTGDPVNEPAYVEAQGQAHSPSISGFRKHSNFAARYEVCQSKRYSPDAYSRGAIDKTIHGTSLKDRRSHWQPQQKSPLNDSGPFPEQRYSVDAYEDLPSETFLFNGKRNKIKSKHSSQGTRCGSVSDHHGIYGDPLVKRNRASLHNNDIASSKFARKSKNFSRSSDVVHELEGSPDLDHGKEYTERVEKFVGERTPLDRHRDHVRVNTHLIDEPQAGRHARFGFPLEAGVRKVSYNDILPQKSQAKRPAFQVPSSFSEDETAETSSSVD